MKLARPEAPVVAVCGDGSFNVSMPTAHCGPRTATAPHSWRSSSTTTRIGPSKLPVIQLYPDGVSVRANDFPETQLTPDTDYAALAKACGGTGQTVHRPQDMGDAIRWALAEADQGRCAILDVLLPQP